MNGSEFVLVGLSLGAAKAVHASWLHVQNIISAAALSDRIAPCGIYSVSIIRFSTAMIESFGIEVRV